MSKKTPAKKKVTKKKTETSSPKEDDSLLVKAKEIRNKILTRNNTRKPLTTPILRNAKVVKQGNFTVALVQNGSKGWFVGVTKRNPSDGNNNEIATSVALHRAISQMIDKKIKPIKEA